MSILLLAVGLLFDSGRTSHSVVVPEPTVPEIAYAAQEFTSAVWRVSGASLPIVREKSASPCVRFVQEGDAASADEHLAYRVEGENLTIAGNLPRAVLHATYAFLRRELGVRWYYPDKEGEIFPPRARFELHGDLAYSFVPPIRYRGFHLCGDQYRRTDFLAFASRNFANIHRRGVRPEDRKFGFWNMRSTHGAYLGDDRALFAEHPEYYAELNGRRSRSNICLSSDGAVGEVVKKLDGTCLAQDSLDIFSFFPFDNQDYCRCAACRKQSVSENWFRFYGKCVGKFRERHPKLKFATIAYQGYRDVPECEIPDTEFVEFATHGRCNHHRYLTEPCAASAKDLAWMRAWAAKGVPTGQYNYEFDVHLRNTRFLPYFSLVDDAVNAAAALRQRAIIPEVSLSPRHGPDVNVSWLQNRLALAWYAQKMFDPTLAWRPWLKEATGHLFGPAADGVYRYLVGFDAAWTGQKEHIAILGDSISCADRVLTDETVRTLSAALADAERALSSCSGIGRNRYQSNLRREQALWRQWLDSLAQKKGIGDIIRVPLTGKDASGAPYSWSADVGRRGERLARSFFMKSDAAKVQSVVLRPSDSGETYAFTRSATGTWKSVRTSEVGVADTAWKGETRETADGLSFDLSAFRRRPLAGEVWTLDQATDRETVCAQVRFTELTAVDRPVAWWIGKPERDVRRIPTYRASAADLGFAVTCCTNAAEFVPAVAKSRLIYIHNPGLSFTADCGAAVRAALARGATAYIVGFNGFRLEKVLGDPQLRSQPGFAAAGAHGQRRTSSFLEGPWCRTPWNIEPRIKHAITPAYVQAGIGDGWTVLAKVRGRDGSDTPYLSCRKVGSGLLILGGAEIAIEPMKVLDNIHHQFNP